MNERCPTCARPLETEALTDRILALLVTTGRPMRAAEMARKLGARSVMVYQATRRLAERGAIRKGSADATGPAGGWVLTPHALAPKQATPVKAAVASAEDAASHLPDLLSFVWTMDGARVSQVLLFLRELGVGDENAADLIEVAIEMGRLIRQGDSLVVPPAGEGG